jgi:hypothetical protein
LFVSGAYARPRPQVKNSSIDAFGLADEFVDRTASVWSKPIVDRQEDGDMTYASSRQTMPRPMVFEVSR